MTKGSEYTPTPGSLRPGARGSVQLKGVVFICRGGSTLRPQARDLLGADEAAYDEGVGVHSDPKVAPTPGSKS